MLPTQHKPTLRVLNVLVSLADKRSEGLTLTELAEKIQIPVSTVFPIVHTLRENGFIELKNDGKYIIGINMFLISSSSLQHTSLLDIFKKEMKKITDQTSETCQLGILVGSDILYLARENSPEPIRILSPVGNRLPAYKTALGKALLCEYSRQDLTDMYNLPFEAISEKHCIHINKFYDECRQSKNNGYFQEIGEVAPDLSSFAVPIRNNDKIIAAISVCIPTCRLTEKKKALTISSLFAGQNALERNLQHLYITDNNMLLNSFLA